MRAGSRDGLGTLDFVLLGATLGLVALVILPAYLKSTVSLDVQRCFALQRRLHAAVDAYETDNRVRLPDLQQALPLLLKNGYLSELPLDPGDGREASVSHYGRNADGAVYCWVHGSPWPRTVRPEREPHDQRFIGPPPPPPKPASVKPGPVTVKKIPGFWR